VLAFIYAKSITLILLKEGKKRLDKLSSIRVVFYLMF